MEDEVYKDDFEQFLQKHANNHRMYPSDRIWPAIHQKLHGYKKWPALTIAAIGMLATTIAVTVYFTPGSKIFDITAQRGPLADNNIKTKRSNILIQPFYKSLNQTGPNTNPVNTNRSLIKPDSEITNDKTAGNNDFIPLAIVEVSTIVSDLALKPDNLKKESSSANNTVEARKNAFIANEKTGEIGQNSSSKEDVDTAAIQFSVTVNGKSINEAIKNTPGAITATESSEGKMVDKFLGEHTNKTRDIDLISSRKKNKFSYTIYATPSASYRRLKEENILQRNNLQNNGPIALNFVADVNKVVRHRPGIGFETGIGFTYQLTSTLGIRTGLQFNFRQYNINAYRSPYELTSIALVSNTGVDTINLLAGYRNNNGISSAEIVNRYFQVSIPVGIDWQVIGNQKIGFNLAATIQPTYVFKSNPYVLSSNFKNYTRNSNMLRQWNINSSVEAYLSVKTGEYRWQIGPQVRYQQLPTLKSAYPIHENLVDYGFKVGVTRFIK